MILAVVGYRRFNDYKLFTQKVDEFILKHGKVAKIISGGCSGADTMAEQYAKEHGMPFQAFLPDDRIKNNSKFAKRDKEIAQECTHLLAFPSTKGKGTQLTIGFAKELGKEVIIYWV